MSDDERLSLLTDQLLKANHQIAALQTILVDVLASGFMASPDPAQAARDYREQFRNMLVRHPPPFLPNDGGYSEFFAGETADFVDILLEMVVGTVVGRLVQKDGER